MPSFLVTQDASSHTPYVYLDTFDAGAAGSDLGSPISIDIESLPFVRANLPGRDQPNTSTPLLGVDADLIALHVSWTPSTTGELQPAVVASVKASVWQFDAVQGGYRAAICDAFDTFRARLEVLERPQAAAPPMIVPGGSDVVARQVGSHLPATFPESLYFHYGRRNHGAQSAPGAGGARSYVDLRAGMRLRLETQISQFVPPAASGYTPGLNGYVATGQAYYEMVETPLETDTPDLAAGTPLLGLDSFLATNVLPGVQPNSAGGVGGVIDLQGMARRRRYLRLCYPAALPASDMPGSAGPADHATLIGANSLRSLTAATDSFYSTGDLQGVPDATLTFLRGRVVAVPEIACLGPFGTSVTYVPLGTTVRHLVQRFTPLPRLAGLDVSAAFQPSWYQRFVPAAGLPVTPPTRATLIGAYRNVAFSPSATGSGAWASDSFDLPVLAGDVLRLAFA